MNFFGFVRRIRLSYVFVGIAVFTIMLNANINYAIASVSTYRIDNHLESLIHAAELEYTNFIKDTLTNLDDVKAIRIESHGVKVGLKIDAGLNSDIEISAPITLINDTNEDARVEINDGNSVRLHDVTVINRKGLIQLNDESNVTIDHISVESSAYLNLQVNKIDGSIEDTGIFTIGVIDLAENAKVRGSVYGKEPSSGWEKTNSNLVVTGKDITINLAEGAGADFGGYKEKDDHSWRPEDIEFSAQSVTINIANSSSGNYVYFSGVDGKLKTKPGDIHVVANSSNNSGNAVADLEKLANVVKTNEKVGEEKQNELSCLPGVIVEQKASDIYDGATAIVAEGCPNCTITNVRIQDNPNVHGIAEMAALGLHIWRNEIDDMHRRVGELRDSSAQSNGLWTRVYHGKAEYGDQNVTKPLSNLATTVKFVMASGWVAHSRTPMVIITLTMVTETAIFIRSAVMALGFSKMACTLTQSEKSDG